MKLRGDLLYFNKLGRIHVTGAEWVVVRLGRRGLL